MTSDIVANPPFFLSCFFLPSITFFCVFTINMGPTYYEVYMKSLVFVAKTQNTN